MDLQPWVAQATAVSFEAGSGPHGNHFPALAGSMLTVVLEGRLHLHTTRDPVPRPLPSAVVTGPSTAPMESTFTGRLRCVSVLLYPAATAALLCDGASSVTDRAVAAAEVFGASWVACEDAMRSASDDRHSLLWLFGFLRRRLCSDAALDSTRQRQRMQRALSRPVPEAARLVGLGERQFERVFSHHFGMTPKLFQRMARLEAALLDALVNRTPGAELALRHGYYDQAHLARDCRLLAGAPLTRLMDASGSPGSEHWPLEIGAGHARGQAVPLG